MKPYVKLIISGLEVFIDVEDVQILIDYRWHKHKNKSNNKFYMRGWCKASKKKIMMYRLLLDANKGEQVDHVNGNPLDNRKCNLRAASHANNITNRKAPKSNTSGYKEVSKRGNKWKATISHKGTRYYLGTFNTKLEASLT